MTPETVLARPSFPEWAATEIDRLIRAHQSARSVEEQAQVELQLALICEAAHRYGRSLAEAAEI